MKKQFFSQIMLLSLMLFPLQAWSQIIIIDEEPCCDQDSSADKGDNCPDYDAQRFRRRRRRRRRRPIRRQRSYYQAPKPVQYRPLDNQVSKIAAPDNLPDFKQIKHWELSLIWSSSADNTETYSGAGVGLNLMFNQRWGLQGYLESVSNYNEDDYYSYNEINIFRAGLNMLWYPFGDGFTNMGFNFYLKAGLTFQNYETPTAVYGYDSAYDSYYDYESAGGSSVELGAGLKYFFWDGWFSMTLEAVVLSDPFGESDPQYSETFGSSSTFRFYTSFHF